MLTLLDIPSISNFVPFLVCDLLGYLCLQINNEQITNLLELT